MDPIGTATKSQHQAVAYALTGCVYFKTLSTQLKIIVDYAKARIILHNIWRSYTYSIRQHQVFVYSIKHLKTMFTYSLNYLHFYYGTKDRVSI